MKDGELVGSFDGDDVGFAEVGAPVGCGVGDDVGAQVTLQQVVLQN